MLKYWIWLATRKGLSARTICRIARWFPSPQAAFYAPPEAYSGIPGLREPKSLLDKDMNGAEDILIRCRKKGIRIMTMQDAAYPEQLRQLSDAPIVLYCKGMPVDLTAPMLGVVGTRDASVYGRTQAKQFGYGLARSGCTVVSGGAGGVDTEALRGAILGGGEAIAVLGCGVDVVYPSENKELFRTIEEHGCLISEYPPGTRPYRFNFPARNRIISGLSLGVLVVEAPQKSGALITAKHAEDQNRDIFALPANVGVASCAGNLELLRNGAAPAMDAWDIVQTYLAQYPELLRENHDILPREAGEEAVPETENEKLVIDKPEPKAYIDLKDTQITLTQEERQLLELLRDGAKHIDELVAKTGIVSSRALSMLTMLQVRGIVCRPAVGMYELAEK